MECTTVGSWLEGGTTFFVGTCGCELRSPSGMSTGSLQPLADRSSFRFSMLFKVACCMIPSFALWPEIAQGRGSALKTCFQAPAEQTTRITGRM